MSKEPSTARCFSNDGKQASLFFDYVIPFVPDMAFAFTVDSIYSAVEIDLPPVIPEFLGKKAQADLLKIRSKVGDIRMNKVSLDQEIELIDSLEDQPSKTKRLATVKKRMKEYDEMRKKVSMSATRFCDRYRLNDIPAIIPNDSQSLASTPERALSIIISNWKVIDTQNTSWGHILEFRKDNESREALQRLIRYINSKHETSSPKEILEDFEEHMDSYNRAVENWGFETRHGTLSMVLNSKLLQGSAAATTIGALFGLPIELTAVGVLSGIIGAVIEIGQVTLHLDKQDFELAKLRRDTPVSYLIQAKEKLGSST